MSKSPKVKVWCGKVRCAHRVLECDNCHAFAIRAINRENGFGTDEVGPEHLCPEPAPGLEFDHRGVLVPITHERETLQ